MFKFTICTPTYNRAYILHRVYDSLLKQTYKNFEWIIVDDGSTDDTKNIVSSWIKSDEINIKYTYQKNAGKHIALNNAIDNANGEFFLIFDSDDMCVENTLEVFLAYWNTIEDKENFVGVTALYKDMNSKQLGMNFPKDIFDSNTIECRYSHKIVGDKWGFQRLDILKENRFPEYPGEKFLAEGIVWNKIASKYSTRYINQYLGIVDYQESGLSANSLNLRINNPNGALHYYNSELSIRIIPLFRKFKDGINYIRFSKHAKKSLFQIVKNSTNKPIVLFSLVFGYLFYIKDCFNKT